MKKSLMVIPLVTLSFGVMAQPVSSQLYLRDDSVSFVFGLGWLKGESNEHLYGYSEDPKYKSSQLDWKIGDVLIARGKVSWDLLDRLTVNAGGWVKLSSRNSKMDDYDWMDINQSHWTDWSSSPDTSLNDANEFDFNAAGWLIKQPDYKLGAVLGYQETRFSWTAYGGHYVYKKGANVGEFPSGMAGIGYKQKYSLPYIGLTGQYRYQDFEFNLLLKYSPWVKAWSHDQHYMRRLTLPQKSDKVHYYGASVDAGYYLTQNAKLYTAFTWNKYREGKGKTKFIYSDTGYVADLGDDSIGIENRNYSIDLGLQYHF
ncbi:omptin family outer membrane protease [Xenorhabdus sp. IM139775]|uniref:omptin family outer membrane protease n=1 Tax=Xenorhabdus sp. IM139775 TaxID=3025876 RepID=UPI00235A3C73|nr:omptin family outer membrane protease [Xenorhabdus sp. IM139775]MDC9594740.1 omptin family outer membrane protease [Xenorhabdus sp. IM139775]